MPKRVSRDGSIVEPHAIKLEEMYRHMFEWLKLKKKINKTDVIRNSVEDYFVSNGGDLDKIKARCENFKKKPSN